MYDSSAHTLKSRMDRFRAQGWRCIPCGVYHEVREKLRLLVDTFISPTTRARHDATV
jgi:hypothetical protein